MITYYFNNFRGFHHSILNLKNVNFFVGENSTGKTSILSIIKILSSPEFMFIPKFNTDEIEFGYFDDIASLNKRGDNFFELGVMPPTYTHQKMGGLGAYLMKFGEVDGKPTLVEFRYLSRNKTVRVVFQGKNTQFSICDSEMPKFSNETQKITFFKGWIEDENLINAPLEKLKINYPGNTPLYIIKMIIEEEHLQLTNSNRRPSVGWPLIFDSDFTWIGPIRAKPKRIYEQYREKHTPEGEHMPIMIKSILKRNDENLIHALNSFGIESGLFDELKTIDLGNGKTSPFEIHVKLNRSVFRISNVGYGVSQILPLISEILLAEKEQWFAIQQPEVHLHPRAQASFGEFIFNAFESRQVNFIIETHSDHTIDRFRLNYKNKYTDKLGKAQVIFFERKKSQNIIHHIPILENGKYYEHQPDSFREFFINEELSLLEI